MLPDKKCRNVGGAVLVISTLPRVCTDPLRPARKKAPLKDPLCALKKYGSGRAGPLPAGGRSGAGARICREVSDIKGGEGIGVRCSGRRLGRVLRLDFLGFMWRTLIEIKVFGIKPCLKYLCYASVAQRVL